MKTVLTNFSHRHSLNASNTDSHTISTKTWVPDHLCVRRLVSKQYKQLSYL